MPFRSIHKETLKEKSALLTGSGAYKARLGPHSKVKGRESSDSGLGLVFCSYWGQVWGLVSRAYSLWVHLKHKSVWGTIPCMRNVAQPPLGKASGERGWREDPHPWIGSPVGNHACIVP